MAGRNNVFAIDFDAVVQTINDSNESLVKRHEDLMAARDRIPAALHANDEVAKAKRFAEQLNEHASLCRSTRLSDTKPLRELVKHVEGFFKNMENDTKVAQEKVLEVLGEKARETYPPSQSGSDWNRDGESFLVDNTTGEVLGSTYPTQSGHPAGAEAIRMSWEIEDIDREAMDLEALREHLTDAALMNAARKHLKSNGPHTLRGATYRQVAVL